MLQTHTQDPQPQKASKGPIHTTFAPEHLQDPWLSRHGCARTNPSRFLPGEGHRLLHLAQGPCLPLGSLSPKGISV